MFLQLAESDFASTFRLLTVFAYGTYADYLGNLRGLELWSSGGGRRAIFGRTRRNSWETFLRYTGSELRLELAWKTGGKKKMKKQGKEARASHKSVIRISYTCLFFLAEARNLPPLTEAQKNKLRHLSVVTLAAKVKVSDCLSPYTTPTPSQPGSEPKRNVPSKGLSEGNLLSDSLCPHCRSSAFPKPHVPPRSVSELHFLQQPFGLNSIFFAFCFVFVFHSTFFAFWVKIATRVPFAC